MQVNDIISALLARTSKTQEQVSTELGRAKAWASVVKSTKRTPRLDTVADIADACDIDICLIDRETGAGVATVTPPRRAQAD